MDRNLVLLLSSGHTVRIALKPDDLTYNVGPVTADVMAFLAELPAVVVGGPAPEKNITFAYIEDPSPPLPGTLDDRRIAKPNDLQRITTEGPGCYHDGH